MSKGVEVASLDVRSIDVLISSLGRGKSTEEINGMKESLLVGLGILNDDGSKQLNPDEIVLQEVGHRLQSENCVKLGMYAVGLLEKLKEEHEPKLTGIERAGIRDLEGTLRQAARNLRLGGPVLAPEARSGSVRQRFF